MLTHNLLRNRADELTPQERDLVEGAVSHTQNFAAGQIVVRQGVPINISTLLVEGFMTRHVDAPDGRRHLVAVHVPGDFVDLHAYPLKKLDHDVGALTDVSVAIVTHDALERIQQADTRLTRRLWFLTLIDAAMHRQWIFRLASLRYRSTGGAQIQRRRNPGNCFIRYTYSSQLYNPSNTMRACVFEHS